MSKRDEMAGLEVKADEPFLGGSFYPESAPPKEGRRKRLGWGSAGPLERQ